MSFISSLYQRFAYSSQRLLVAINPKIEANRYYYSVFHKVIDWNNPQNLVEKINWLQHNTDTSLWTLCADKYRVRGFIEKNGLGEYLPQIYGKWDKPSEIDFKSLPKSFVLKLNNGCGSVIVIKNKDEIDPHAVAKLDHWLRHPYGYRGAQLHYIRIKPCVFAEELLQNDYEFASPDSMVDFKIWCFLGKPESVLVTGNRKNDTHSTMFYDLDWNKHPEWLKHPSTNFEIPRPACLEEMLMICKTLSKEFSEVRVDFYVVNNKPVIGELTFTAGFGSYTEDYFNYLGTLVDISTCKIK